MKKILLIIPAYNEEKNIMSVIESIKKANSSLENKYDYIVINDCSRDNTKNLLLNSNADFIDLSINLGIGGGVQAGYLYAYENNYDIAVQMDGDGQHDIDYVKNLIEPILNEEADVVIGSRFITKEGFQSSGIRRLGINILSTLIKIACGIKIYDVTSGFRAVNKKLIKIFSNEYAQDYPEPEAIVACVMNNAKIMEVPVVMHERTGGTSSINSFKSIYYMIKVSIAILIYRITFDKK